MANYHFHLQIIGRAGRRSSVAAAAYTSGSSVMHVRSVVGSAAYRAGEKLNDLTNNLTHDFTRKSGVVYDNILLPDNAPERFRDRETLWNAVEKAEKRCDSRLAREIEVSLPIEFDREEQIELINDYVSDNFVKEGMCADVSIHDKGDGNPHAHILLTVRDVDGNGFVDKQNKSRQWNNTAYLHKWRENWAKECNDLFKEKGLDTRIDHRTLEAQGIDRLPTIHLGHEAHALEKKGIRTRRGDINREIVTLNLKQKKEKHTSLSMQISKMNIKNASTNKSINNFNKKVSNIRKAKYDLQQIEKKINNVKYEQESTKWFDVKQKKELGERLAEFEEYRDQVRAKFLERYRVSIDNADSLTVPLENELKALRAEKWDDKLNELLEQRKGIEVEYKRIKSSADRHYFFDDGQLDNAVKGIPPRNEKDRLFYLYTEEKLNDFSFDDYREAMEQGKDAVRSFVLIR